MIEIYYGEIQDVIEILDEQYGKFISKQHGRAIGAGAETRAKWMGEGWLVHTDHFRTVGRGLTVKAFVSFTDSRVETIFRLKYPKMVKR